MLLSYYNSLDVVDMELHEGYEFSHYLDTLVVVNFVSDSMCLLLSLCIFIEFYLCTLFIIT